MRKLPKFTLIGGVTLVVALGGALASLFELWKLALIAGNLAIALVAGLVVWADRRRRLQARRERRALGSSLTQLNRQALRIEQQVDMVQRRVVSALEAARLEEIDRARAAQDSR